MKVPFVGYKIQYQSLKKELDEKMQDVLSRGDLILRKDTEEFERRLAEFVGTKYAIGLNSGTDALFLSLLALGIGKGDEVITVSHTFIATIAAVVQAGANPILVDVGDDFEIDVSKIETAITSKTKAIIPVHYNGRMADMEKIMKIAEKHKIYVIEDAAQGLGSSLGGKRAGSWGITGCFSFYPAKILGCFGDGGALTTNDVNIADKIKLLRDHGQKTKTDLVCFGWNSRIDNLQAAVLNVKMNYLPQWLERRREIAKIYNKGLSHIGQLKLPAGFESDNRYDVFQNYVLRAEKRNELFNFLKEKEVECLIKDPVANHIQPDLRLSSFKLSNSEILADEVISLPMYPELENDQISYVIECIKEFYKS